MTKTKCLTFTVFASVAICACMVNTGERLRVKTDNRHLVPIRSFDTRLASARTNFLEDALLTNGYNVVSLHRTRDGLFELPFSYRQTNACFMIDSGAGNNLVYRSFAESLDLDIVSTMSSIGLIDTTVFPTNIILKQGLPCWIEDRFIVRPDRPVSSNVVPDAAHERWLSYGIIGSGFLRRHRAVMNYASGNLFLDLTLERRVHEIGLSRRAMQKEGYSAIPMNWDDKTRQWTLSGQINEAPLTFLLDTGSNVTCVDRSLASQIAFSGPETEIGLTGEAHRKGDKASRVRVTELRLGDFSTEATHVYLTPSGGHNTPGFLIGADVLAMHRAVLDFGENMLYLRRASVKDKPR